MIRDESPGHIISTANTQDASLFTGLKDVDNIFTNTTLYVLAAMMSVSDY